MGASHLIDPSRLVSSAARLYGDRMDALWGEVVPVPAERVIPLTDGETQEAAGHVLSVLFTPGHASHHVAYWEPDLGAVFTGDVGGVRMPGSDYVLPPAPPPDLAPDDWAISTERLRQAGPRRLYLTHGGPFDDGAAHFEQLMPNLAEVEEICRTVMLGGADDEAVTNLLQTHTERRIGAAATEDVGSSSGTAGPRRAFYRRSDSGGCSPGVAIFPGRIDRRAEDGEHRVVAGPNQELPALVAIAEISCVRHQPRASGCDRSRFSCDELETGLP